MKDVKIPTDARNWDYYQAFHTFCGVGVNDFRRRTTGAPPTPLVLFDTGELICTSSAPGPHERREYHSVGVSLTSTKHQQLWLPSGRPAQGAWLDDSGMQYLLVDHETRRAARLDGRHRYAPYIDSRDKPQPGAPITAGIPLRFQYNCRAYIPGAGLPPVAHAQIKVSIPVDKAGYTKDEREHIKMIVSTGWAAMKLTDHAALQRTASVGADPDALLKCTTWTDVPEAMLPSLVHYGAGRVVRWFDYLLTEDPR